MKTRRFAVGLLCLAAFAAWGPGALADTNTVSIPAGFVRIEAPPGTNTYLLAGMPFDALNFEYGVAAVLSGQLTGSTNQSAADLLRKYDTNAAAYVSVYKWTNGMWYSAIPPGETSSLCLFPGEAAFLGNRQSQTQTVFLCGYVVLDSSFTNTVATNFSLMSYPFSSAVLLNGTALSNGAHSAALPDAADRISAWDTASQSYTPIYALKNADTQWHGISSNDWYGAAASDFLRFGQGFWYQNVGAAFNWAESRPYANIYPADTALTTRS